MSGGYLHPRRRLRTTDITDPREFNADVLPAAERYSGRLNAHNFRSTLKAALNLSVGDDAYYRFDPSTSYISVSSDPGNGTWAAANPASPQTGDPNIWNLPNTTSWEVVGSMTRTVTTGVSVLWVLGWLQYTWHVWTGGAGTVPHPGVDSKITGTVNFPGTYPGSDREPANVIFALRVDGRIVPGTITGQDSHSEKNRMALRPSSDFDTNDYYPGPRQWTSAQAHALGAHHRPVRMHARVPVQPGAHVVEIIARRVSCVSDKNGFGSNDYISVYSRRLFALDIIQMPPAALAAASVAADTFESEDLFSTAAVDTASFQPIRAAYNDVAEGALARGAFMNEHLPSALLDWAQATITVEQVTNDRYPGFGTGLSIAPAAAKTGVTGWWLLDNGAGLNLRTDQTGGVFDVSTRRSLLIVMANVEVRAVRSTTQPTDFESYRDFGVFALGYRFSNDAVGTVRIVGETEASFNSNNPNLCEETIGAGQSTRAENRDIWADIPLLWVIDYTAAPAGANIDWFGVYASAPFDNSDPVGANDRVDITYRNGAILVVQLRP